MDKYEYQVIMARIQEIEQEQLSWMEYLSNSLDLMIDEQKENVRDRMLQLREEKEVLKSMI